MLRTKYIEQTNGNTYRKTDGRRTESYQKSIIELSAQMSQILKRFILTCFIPNSYKMLPSFSLSLKKDVLCLEYYLFYGLRWTILKIHTTCFQFW